MTDLQRSMEEVLFLTQVVEKKESRYAEQLYQGLQKSRKAHLKSCSNCRNVLGKEITEFNDAFKSILRTRKRLWNAKKKVTDTVIKNANVENTKSAKSMIKKPVNLKDGKVKK